MSYSFLNSKFIKSKKAQIQINDEGLNFGYAIYETLHGFNDKIWNTNVHLRRLRNSAKELKIKIPYSNKQIEEILKKLTSKNKLKESKIKILVTPQNFLITQEKYTQPTHPQKVITIKSERPLSKIKSTSLINSVLARKEAEKQKAIDAIFINEKDQALEGTTSNIFIIKNKTLITTTQNALPGTTQEYIINLAKKLNMKTKIQTITLKQMEQADEFFITSSLKLILPITKINKKTIKNGRIGPLTKTLIDGLKANLPN